MHCMHFDYTAYMFRNTSQKQRLLPYTTLSTYINFILVIRSVPVLYTHLKLHVALTKGERAKKKQ